VPQKPKDTSSLCALIKCLTHWPNFVGFQLETISVIKNNNKI